jgi:hypothetical protein
MNAPSARPVDPRCLIVLLIPLACLLGLTALTVHVGLNLADEGFLWYGAQRTLAGEVPIRDFMAYEPGRYYWTALWMWLAHDDGIIVMRWSAVLFEALAIVTMALAVWRRTRSMTTSVLASASCIFLMNQWHARYEPAVALLQMVVLAYLLEKPAGARFFWSGLQVGFAAFFGRNLALYGLIGLLIALALMAYTDRRILSWRRLLLLATGILAGSLPFLTMLLFTRGFATAVWDSILRHFDLGATNLPLPIPWPWTLPFGGQPPSIKTAEVLYGLFYLLVPFFGLGVIVWRLSSKQLASDAQFTAAALLSIPYAHYIFSRADTEHLSRGGAPLVLALALTPVCQRPRLRSVPAIGVAAALACMMPVQFHGRTIVGDFTESPLAYWVGKKSHCEEATVGVDRLCVPEGTAWTIEGARALVARFVKPGDSVLIAPYDPGLYAVLGLRAPTWEIYPLFQATPRLELAEITRLEQAHTRLAIISMDYIDERPELHYTATHPMLAQFLVTRFAHVAQNALPPHFVVGARPQASSAE